ncbi:cupin domain-containing protein [Mucilaginibacter paludis]|nr:cupin domain-containing protein [Mucilaginibacter paludis]
MEEDILIQISNKIKERRREKNITVHDLAIKANVSKGLISQIENSRTIPSLIVLIDIIRSLDIDLNVFFKDIHSKSSSTPIIVRRKEQYEHFEKEDAHGFYYQRIFTQHIKHSTVDFVLLELNVDASRPFVETQAFEFKYFLSGEIAYHFNDKTITFSAGDSMLFDGRIPHTPKNIGTEKAMMLVIYFFEENKV